MAEFNENPIGWMKLYNNENQERFYVSSLYVLPDNQGFRIGRKLLEVAESLADKMNLTGFESFELVRENRILFYRRRTFPNGQNLCDTSYRT